MVRDPYEVYTERCLQTNKPRLTREEFMSMYWERHEPAAADNLRRFLADYFSTNVTETDSYCDYVDWAQTRGLWPLPAEKYSPIFRPLYAEKARDTVRAFHSQSGVELRLSEEAAALEIGRAHV
jgi:hypothetical protein